jgi:hypothetical protein
MPREDERRAARAAGLLVDRREKWLLDRHREVVWAGSRRPSQQAWLPPNVTPHNAHAGPSGTFWAADGPGVEQEDGPRRKALAHSPGVVRTL